MTENRYLCPRCRASRRSPVEACAYCGWQPEQVLHVRKISRRAMLGLAAGTGVLALGAGVFALKSGVWRGLMGQPHPQLLIYNGHHSAQITALAWSADGNTIASGDSQGNVLLWDTASGKTMQTYYEAGSGSVLSVSWSPDDASLLLVGFTSMLTIRDTGSGKTTFTTTALTGPAAYSTMGDHKPCYLLYQTLIAATHSQESVQIFPSTSLTTPIASIPTGRISELAFNADPGFYDLAVVALMPARNLAIYGATIVPNCSGDNQVNTQLSFALADPISSTDTSSGNLETNWGSGGRYLLGGAPGATVMIEGSWGTYKMTHPTNVVAAALCPAQQSLPPGANPDGWYTVIGYIATADAAGTVRIWGNDQQYLTVMQVQQQVQLLSWSSDGNFLAIVTADGVVQVWEASFGTLPAIWRDTSFN